MKKFNHDTVTVNQLTEIRMGAFLSVINDDFKKEREFGYIDDIQLDQIVQKCSTMQLPCLQNILGYENTIFNSAQMKDIEFELEKLYKCFDDEKVIRILNSIAEAIKFSKKEPPLYLFFEGD